MQVKIFENFDWSQIERDVNKFLADLQTQNVTQLQIVTNSVYDKFRNHILYNFVIMYNTGKPKNNG